MGKEELKKRIIEIIKGKLPLPHYRVFFFGSRVNGKAGDRSDYDLGIEAAEKIPPGILMDMESELKDLRIMQKIDLVDFAVVGKEFKAVAMNDIEVIYER